LVIKEPEVFYNGALFVQQIVPASIDGKRDIDELLKIRIVDDDDESLDLSAYSNDLNMTGSSQQPFANLIA